MSKSWGTRLAWLPKLNRPVPEGMNNPLETPPYYAIQIAPGIHHTMGGVRSNTSAEVLNTEGNPIPGLFAAGEVTGGLHGGKRTVRVVL